MGCINYSENPNLAPKGTSFEDMAESMENPEAADVTPSEETK